MTDHLQPSPPETEFLLYQTDDGRTQVEVRFDGETAWLSLSQMAELFQRDKSVISRHIKNVFSEGELWRESVVARFATPGSRGTVADRATVRHSEKRDVMQHGAVVNQEVRR